METKEKRLSSFLLNKLEKTNFNHVENYPIMGSFSIIGIEINKQNYFLVRGIKNKCFFEGVFKERIKAEITIKEIKKG
jgi:hypothetical protein